jgi:outer membrane receptor protein involved in Fe transport
MAYRQLYHGVAAAFALAAAAAPACASADVRQQVDIRGGRLSAALAEFARETGAELLFDQKLVSGNIVPPVRGSLSRREALSRLLAGTGVGFREAGGSFVLFRAPAQPEPPLTDEPAVPEILVIGRRTQNADIRRTENDIQPYKVSIRREIENAHRSNIEEFTRARVPANAQTRTLAQDVMGLEAGSVRSGIDLRGLGRRRTLVLVDGRRLPSSLEFPIEFDQADLNGIPLSAIERIETLTGTAGGIYGPGALGGVVNVVLRRDYSGADLRVTSGISSRGDAKRLQVEGRFGFSPDYGRTGVMVLASHQISQPLMLGDRDFEVLARRRQLANDPLAYLSQLRSGNSVSLYSASGANLVLDPEFGGGSLGASYTYLPLGFAGTRAEAVALLQQNAGRVDLELTPDRAGLFQSSVSQATVSSGLVNLRHQLSDDFELFVDGLAYRNKGVFRTGSRQSSFPTLASAPTNPFSENVYFRYPLPDSRQENRVTLDTARLSGGVIARLPGGWSGSADVGLGYSRVKSRNGGMSLEGRYNEALSRGRPDPRGLPVIDPLGNWEDLRAATALYQVQSERSFTSRNRFSEANVRLAGPLLRSRAGPVVISLLAQQRTEKVPETVVRNPFGDRYLPFRKQAVTSGYAELRAPVLIGKGRILPGLELQVAGRYDHASTTFPEIATFIKPQVGPAMRVGRDGFNYTFGAKFYPLSWVMLRGSVATGELYPTVGQLAPLLTTVQFRGVGSFGGADPRRGGEPIGDGDPVAILRGGSPRIKSEQATTITFGAVFSPSGGNGPRVSIDFSRIGRRREIFPFPLSMTELLAREDSFPGRVSRRPLTEADARLGFTAGQVTSIDFTAVNRGRTIAEAVDVEFNWPTQFPNGSELQIYGSATWQPSLRMSGGAGQPWFERAGYFDGPLSWRGNVGAEWRRGPVSVDLNLQFFGRYRVTYADPNAAGAVLVGNEQLLRYNGGVHIPSQGYADLSARRRFPLAAPGGPLDAVEVRFGVQNLFDKRPPVIANRQEVPYSTYGDARRRRFELTLSSEF